MWEEQREERILCLFASKKQSSACFYCLTLPSGCLPKPKTFCFKNLPSDTGAELKELEKLELIISNSNLKMLLSASKNCPHVSPWDLLQWVCANAFHFTELHATKIHPLLPVLSVGFPLTNPQVDAKFIFQTFQTRCSAMLTGITLLTQNHKRQKILIL